MQLIFCDESCHLEKDNIDFMILGAIRLPKEKKEKIYKEIKEIKEKHNLSAKFEIKWTKVSISKIEFYEEIIDYFFQNKNLEFRAVIASKKNLKFGIYDKNDDYDSWYYKMYYQLLNKFIESRKKNRIFLDIKDSRGGKKIKLLKKILTTKEFVGDINQVPSNTSEVLQITDLLIGALGYYNRKLNNNKGKVKLIDKILFRTEELGIDISNSTRLKDKKFNIFYWEGRKR